MILAKKNRIFALLMVAATVTGLTSCLKNNSNPQPNYNAFAYFANVATTPYKITFFQNNADLRPDGLDFTTVAAGQVKPGPAKMDFKRLGSDTLLTSSNVTLDTLRYFSFFVYGSQELGVKTHIIREDFSNISTSKANVRFYNMSPASEAVDFYFNDAKVASSRMYEDFTSGYFDQLQQYEPNRVEVIVKKAGTDQVLARATDTNLGGSNGTGGSVISIVFTGTPGTTGTRKPTVVAFNH